MNPLKRSFMHNGLPYTLLKRNDVVALYGVGGTYTEKILHYEVDVIYTRQDQYGIREHIAKNDDFGRDRSQCFINETEALVYYEILTRELMSERNLSHRGVKSIAGVEDNCEVVLEYQSVL